MNIKTSELVGHALDWAVAVCQNIECDDENRPIWFGNGETRIDYTPTTDWAQGGPIIEREMIEIIPIIDNLWDAMYQVQHISSEGQTPLIAAMRCYVANKLGDEIEIPDNLKQ